MMDDRNRCSSCKFWNKNSDWNYPNAVNTGTCREIYSGLEIEVHYGWDGGYIEQVETNSNFGCVFHIPK